jgi:two-component system OmpR family sensor kinase
LTGLSLRARLLLVLAALAIVGLVAADVATYTQLRSFLVQRVDRNIDASAPVLARSFTFHGSPDPGELQQLAQSTPGVYIGLLSSDGVVWRAFPKPGERATPQPTLPSDVLSTHASLMTLGAVSGSTRYRARIEPLTQGYALVVAAPLNDVADTLHRLILIELLVTLAVVGLIVGAGLWLVRVGLRPLRRMEETAEAIAAGDLSRRVPDADPRTEVGRLGASLNAMLGQIEQAFAERTASEERLRRFVGDASHELRTPLSSVQAYAELFDRGARDRPQDLERAMAGIEREAQRMGVLVDDLLLLARLDQGRPLDRKPVDVAGLAAEAVEVARTIEPDRPLVLDAPEPVEVEGDPERLRQVIDNLLANVRTHTPPRTGATIRVAAEGGRAILSVADEGPGLSEEQAAKVFERFYRGDQSRARGGGGTGLGLAIVAAIVEAHGGSVRAAPGTDGATFTISLPVRPAQGTEGDGASPARSAATASRPRA